MADTETHVWHISDGNPRPDIDTIIGALSDGEAYQVLRLRRARMIYEIKVIDMAIGALDRAISALSQ